GYVNNAIADPFPGHVRNTTAIEGLGSHGPHEMITPDRVCKASNILSIAGTCVGYCSSWGTVYDPICMTGCTAFFSTALCYTRPSIATAYAIYRQWTVPCDNGSTDPEVVYGQGSTNANAFQQGWYYADNHNPWADDEIAKKRLPTMEKRKLEGIDSPTCCLDTNIFNACCAVGHGTQCGELKK
ncbi:hypothetical protein BGZ46_002869, partial [Entomortierella lignicola]